jgi:transcriptional regulator with XRE-family HTH domain
VKKRIPEELNFHERLVSLRKERGLTQQALAEMVSMHISQIRRYESGQSQPTLDAIRKLAVALSVSADMLRLKRCPAWTRKRRKLSVQRSKASNCATP